MKKSFSEPEALSDSIISIPDIVIPLSLPPSISILKDLFLTLSLVI
ncbi:MAG: hypothetical protein IJP90_09075 [Treponema sp.]|nr:hypothetical protein [Treponema sp.]